MDNLDPHGDDNPDGIGRRKLLECMTWAGTGLLWTLAGGVPHSLGLIGEAMAAEPGAAETGGFTFMQISDSHIGFAKPVNPNVKGTLEAVIGRIAAMPVKPSFIIHTGDITHLSKPSQFDDAAQLISQSGVATHYVPGEHDLLDPEGTEYLAHYGRGTKGAGWYSFDAGGVHFIALVNVATGGRYMSLVNIDNPGGQAGGLGVLGPEQLRWMEDDLRSHTGSTPVVVFAHMPLWAVYPEWGWGTEDGVRALALLKRFGSVTVLNGHIHQVMQKVEGNMTFHTALSTAYPQPAPGTAPKPGPKKVPADKLLTTIGARSVTFRPGRRQLAIVDAPLHT